MRRIMMVCAAVAVLALAALVTTVPASATTSDAAVPGTVPSLVTKPVPPATPDSAACGRNGPNRDGRSLVSASTAVNLRNGSSTGCPAVGAAQRGDQLNYYCYTVGTGGTWTFLKDNRTGVVGWALDANLPANGSSVYCGF